MIKPEQLKTIRTFLTQKNYVEVNKICNFLERLNFNFSSNFTFKSFNYEIWATIVKVLNVGNLSHITNLSTSESYKPYMTHGDLFEMDIATPLTLECELCARVAKYGERSIVNVTPIEMIANLIEYKTWCPKCHARAERETQKSFNSLLSSENIQDDYVAEKYGLTRDKDGAIILQQIKK